jgi:hypothetical protein
MHTELKPSDRACSVDAPAVDYLLDALFAATNLLSPSSCPVRIVKADASDVCVSCSSSRDRPISMLCWLVKHTALEPFDPHLGVRRWTWAASRRRRMRCASPTRPARCTQGLHPPAMLRRIGARASVHAHCRITQSSAQVCEPAHRHGQNAPGARGILAEFHAGRGEAVGLRGGRVLRRDPERGARAAGSAGRHVDYPLFAGLSLRHRRHIPQKQPIIP